MASEIWTIPIPLPRLVLEQLNLSSPLELNIPLDALRTGLRLLIIVATYLLFRPHLEKMFRSMLGRDDEPAAIAQRDAEVLDRIKVLEGQRASVGKAGRTFAVVGANGVPLSVNGPTLEKKKGKGKTVRWEEDQKDSTPKGETSAKKEKKKGKRKA